VYKGVKPGDTKIAIVETTESNFPAGWTLITTTPILDTADSGGEPEDPVIWKENRTWYLAVGENTSAQFEIYSNDTDTESDWTLENTITKAALSVSSPMSIHGLDKFLDENGNAGLIYHVENAPIDSIAAIRLMTSNNHLLGTPANSQWTTSGSDIYYNTGNVGIGTASPVAPAHAYATGTGANYIADKSDTSTGATMAFRKARTGTTNVASGDEIIKIQGQGYNGSSYHSSVLITSEVDGTPGASDMPGRILFKVSPDGSATPLERFRLAEDGIITLTGGASGATAPASIDLDPGSGSLGTDIILQSIEGSGNGTAAQQRTRLDLMPGGTATNAFIRALNENSRTDFSAVRFGIQNNYAVLQNLISGTPATTAVKFAIDLDASSAASGDEFVIGKNGNTASGSSTQIYNLNEGGQPDYPLYREEGSTTDTTDGNGEITVTHGAGFTPDHVILTVSGDNDYTLRVSAITATTFTIVVKDSAGADVTSTSVTFYWQVKDIR
jgi:hypothetical protein